jgi:uncharacterized protein with HEPN domain
VTNRPARIRLEDLRQAIARIRQYTAGLTYAEFIKDEKTMDAVLRNLEVIGEAARNIPEELRGRYPDVEWHRMIGLRNIISHEYFGVDMQIIWEVATRNVPETEPLVADMLDRLSHEPED